MSDETKATVSEQDLDLIKQIVERAVETYGEDRIKAKRLTNALIAAHLVKPIRLNDLLNTCHMDFHGDVIAGAYAHYQPKTGTFKNDWTAQHAEPKGKSIWELLFAELEEAD
jgi:hypothetical protein